MTNENPILRFSILYFLTMFCWASEASPYTLQNRIRKIDFFVSIFGLHPKNNNTHITLYFKYIVIVTNTQALK